MTGAAPEALIVRTAPSSDASCLGQRLGVQPRVLDGQRHCLAFELLALSRIERRVADLVHAGGDRPLEQRAELLEVAQLDLAPGG